MTVYADTSLLVPALVREATSERVQGWLVVNHVVVSAWVHTEIVSALALKRRTGALSPEIAERALAAWHVMRATFVRLPVADGHMAQAADLIARGDANLRAGDALNVAIAGGAGYPLATLDRRLLLACAELGIAAVDPLTG